MIAGVEQKAHFQCFDLPYSDDSFVIAFPAENSEAFLEGHNQAFAYFGGVPRTILYDYVPGHIIGSNEFRHALIELKGAHVSTDPTGQLFIGRGFGICVGTGFQHRNE